MKVISKAPAFQSKQVTCNCGAVLEVEFSDLKRIHYDSDGRDAAYDKIFVTCPECSSTVDVGAVPPHLAQRIPDLNAPRGIGWDR